MPRTPPVQLLLDLEVVLSPPRFATYVRQTGGDRVKAMDLYCWHTDLAAAFYMPLQFAELAARNGAVEAIAAVYGADWHRSPAFQQSLRPRVGHYRMRDDLRSLAQRHQHAGSVVADIKFVFWQHLFVAAQDAVLWNPHLRQAFPGLPPQMTVQAGRGQVRNRIQTIRNFRNRIAHHEPLLSRDLAADLRAALELVEWRRPDIAAWLRSTETVTALLAQRP
ncbi:MAG: hypothetical protein ACU0CO_02255 [Shimia sp.]